MIERETIVKGRGKSAFFHNYIKKCAILIAVAMLAGMCFGTAPAYAADNSGNTVYSQHIVFIAPSAEKIYDGKPLLDAVNVVCFGLPTGYSYKACAKGSITYPMDNEDGNNVVESYMIFDPRGNDVTELFTNVELRAGTLRIYAPDEGVLGASRVTEDAEAEAPSSETVSGETLIEDESVPLAQLPLSNYDRTETLFGMEVVEYKMYGVLISAAFAVFGLWLADRFGGRKEENK